jgi:hypothetical protein
LDLWQVLVKSTFHEEHNMPVLHHSELLSLTLGIDLKELALQFHKTKAYLVLKKIGQRNTNKAEESFQDPHALLVGAVKSKKQGAMAEANFDIAL